MKFIRHKYLKKFTLLFCAFFIFQFTFTTSIIAFASTDATIFYSINGDPEVGKTIEISINVTNAKNLYGGSFDFTFDPNLIQLETLNKGSIFKDTNAKPHVNDIDNKKGTASIAISLTGNKPGISTNGSLVTFKAKILKEGTLKLQTTNSNNGLSLTGNTCRVKLSDSNGQAIPYTATSNDITLIPDGTISTYEETDSLIEYSGSWANSSDSYHSGGGAKFSSTKDNSFTFAFEGTGFRWYGFGSPTKGIANIYIDGIKQTVDTYSSKNAYQKMFFEETKLANTKHIVTIEVSGDKNTNASNNVIHFDKLDIFNGKLVPVNTVTTYEETNSLIEYSGSWSNSSDSYHSNGGGKFSSSKGSYFTFAFQGTGFKWYGFGSPTKGIANIYIDGVKETVDTYSSKNTYQKMFFEKNKLANTKHIVTIEVSGDNNTNASNNVIHFDKLDIINGNIVPVNTITSYEENNSLIEYTGSWSSSSDSYHSGGGAKFSSNKGDSFTFAFKGTGFRWYGFGSPTKGIANIYIDGVKQTIDTYSSKNVYQKMFFETNKLTNDKHIVTIEVSGDKNTNASNDVIHFDKLDILNGDLVPVIDTINTYEEDSSLIDYSGSWSSSSDSYHSGDGAKFSSSEGSTFTFAFKGTGFRWYGFGSPTKGIANIYIDGVSYAIDTYSPKNAYQKVFFETKNLADTKHIVTIEVSGDKNINASNNVIHFDKLDILNGDLVPVIDTINTYEESDSLIKYSGSWSNSSDSYHSQSSAKFSSTKGASFTFTFNGTGFRWYGFATPTKGIANIYIDGVKQTIDTYSPKNVYQKKFFETNRLANTKHTVTIEVSGLKNDAASNNVIHFDKLEIINGKLLS